MELRLYNFSKRHNSTKQLTNDAAPVATFTDFNLKQNTSLDNPTFLIDDVLRDVNYAYLVDLGHFYFINGYRLGNNYIYEVECEIDALATYKTQILLYEAFVERCADASFYNANLNDTLISIEQHIDNYDQELIDIPAFSRVGCYVMRVVGGDADGVSTFVTDNLANWAGIFDIDNYLDSSTAEWWEKLGNIVFNPWDYIISLSWSPINLSTYISEGAYDADIWVKWFNTGIRGKKLPNNKIAYKSSDDFTMGAVYHDFRKFNPSFTEMYLFIPAVGLIDIDNAKARGTLSVVYTINLDSGSACVDVINKTQGLLMIAHFNTELYVSLQAGSDAWNASGIVGSMISGVGGVIAKDIGAAASGLVNATYNIIKPIPSTIGGSNGVGIAGDPNVRAITLNHGSGEIPTNVAGRPCMKNLQLARLSGFVKCGNASVDIACDEGVKRIINSFLNEGFYIE